MEACFHEKFEFAIRLNCAWGGAEGLGGHFFNFDSFHSIMKTKIIFPYSIYIFLLCPLLSIISRMFYFHNLCQPQPPFRVDRVWLMDKFSCFLRIFLWNNQSGETLYKYFLLLRLAYSCTVSKEWLSLPFHKKIDVHYVDIHALGRWRCNGCGRVSWLIKSLCWETGNVLCIIVKTNPKSCSNYGKCCTGRVQTNCDWNGCHSCMCFLY